MAKRFGFEDESFGGEDVARSGISLRSATEPIDDTSTGKLMEGVLAAFAQFDNDYRSDWTRPGMKAALELGRWTFLTPLGDLNTSRATAQTLVACYAMAPLQTLSADVGLRTQFQNRISNSAQRQSHAVRLGIQ
jgi:DNA invertase Pin-like site-specific DNA recombinase